jgi:hypothetical protein
MTKHNNGIMISEMIKGDVDFLLAFAKLFDILKKEDDDGLLLG